MRGRFGLVLLLAGVLTFSVPSSLWAGDCQGPTEEQLVIFSNTGPNGEIPTVNTAAVTCTVAPEADDHYNLHLINPGSTHIQVRWTGDLGEGVQEIPVVLNGLGFSETSLTARRTPHPLDEGRFFYDTSVVAIPAGPAEQGSITARASYLGVLLGQVTFHTVAG